MGRRRLDEFVKEVNNVKDKYSDVMKDIFYLQSVAQRVVELDYTKVDMIKIKTGL